MDGSSWLGGKNIYIATNNDRQKMGGKGWKANYTNESGERPLERSRVAEVGPRRHAALPALPVSETTESAVVRHVLEVTVGSDDWVNVVQILFADALDIFDFDVVHSHEELDW